MHFAFGKHIRWNTVNEYVNARRRRNSDRVLFAFHRGAILTHVGEKVYSSRSVRSGDGRSIDEAFKFRRRRSVFISRSALTSPGTCMTVNAHSPERCETLSLSMTDITHSRIRPVGSCESPMVTRLGPFRDPCTCEIGTALNTRAWPLLL